jgi:putative heme-binding domain-containing protein
LEALKDSEAAVREQALRLAEEHIGSSAALRKAVVALADDTAPRVRFQLAFTLGEAEGPDVIAALAKIARRDVADPWTQVAVLSSSSRAAPGLLKLLAGDKQFTTRSSRADLQLLTRLAALVGVRAGDADLATALNLLTAEGKAPKDWQIAILDGLGQGLQNSRHSLSRLWEQPAPVLKEALGQARPFFAEAAVTALDEKAAVSKRVAAARLLGYGPFATAATALQPLLSPRNAAELQLAGIRALSFHDNPRVAEMLLASWVSYSPAVRREVLEAVFAKADRLPQLLKAIEQKKVLVGQLEPFRVAQLRKHSDPQLRARALALLSGQVAADRQKVVEAYRSALDLKADASRGKAVFKKTCATCHRLENVGVEVGPDLLSALRNKTREMLLVDIFDPSREVDPRFINYVVTNKAGRVFTGMIAAETASSITLRRAEKAEDTILRSQIEDIEATAKSLMPENLEMQLSKQEVADVIAYLQSVATPK